MQALQNTIISFKEPWANDRHGCNLAAEKKHDHPHPSAVHANALTTLVPTGRACSWRRSSDTDAIARRIVTQVMALSERKLHDCWTA